MLLANSELETVTINNLTLRMAKTRYQKLTKNQLEVIRKYDMDNATGRGNSKTTRENQVDTLIKFAIQTEKEFDDITKDDINLWLMHYKDSSLERYKTEIKKFFRWMEKPELVKHLKSKAIEEKLTKEDMWTEKEIKKIMELIDVDNRIGKRDQAILMCIWDMMLERSAIEKLNIEDVKDDEMGMRLNVDGKLRGKIRKVTLEPIDSILYIRNWLAVHPDRHNPKAPLFVGLSTSNFGQRLQSVYTWHLCKRLENKWEKQTGNHKELRPHLLRHSKATDLYNRGFRGKGLQIQMRHSSLKMQERYAHLSNSDANDERFYYETGIDRKSARKPKKVLMNITCPKCNTLNLATNLYCSECQYPLNSQVSTIETMITEVVQKIIKQQFNEFISDEVKYAQETGETPNMEFLTNKCLESFMESNKAGRKQVQVVKNSP